MYSPPDFTVTDAATIDAMIARSRLGVLVTAGPEGIEATHLPFLWDKEARLLTGHVARANPHPALAGRGEAMVILPGADAYVSPRWYKSTADSGRQVPTWNYEAVHLWGRLSWFDDRKSLLNTVELLTEVHEAYIAEPWSLAEADPAYVERLLGGIIGVRLEVSRIQAKRKLSQNREEIDRQAVIAALEASGDGRNRETAARMREAAS
jgi:transcriptional regulator